MIFSLLAMAVLTAPASADEAIIGGSTTSDYLAVGQLAGTHDRYGLYPFCSGTLVRDQWVITAAHCIEGSAEITAYGFDLVFIVGENVVSSSGITDYQYIETMIEHPDYRGRNYDYDLGLVQLSGEGLPDVPKMPLNVDSVDGSWLRSDITYVGWGINSDRGSGSGVKRTVDVPIFDQTNHIIYTWESAGGANICSGDSGGAALRPDEESGEMELVAINSFGFMLDGSREVLCDDPYAAAGVVRVDAKMEWILDYIGPEPVEEEPEDTTADGEDGAEGDTADGGEGDDDEASSSASPGKGSTCSAVSGAAGGLMVALVGLASVTGRRRDS